jgi:hypothetical protein
VAPGLLPFQDSADHFCPKGSAVLFSYGLPGAVFTVQIPQSITNSSQPIQGSQFMQAPEQLLIWGIVAHLMADWLFQNEWMASKKSDLREPAAWVHSGIHVLFMWLIFPWYLALLIGFSHLVIDSRRPVHWWMSTIKGMPVSTHSEIMMLGMDQTFHVLVLAGIVLLFY